MGIFMSKDFWDYASKITGITSVESAFIKWANTQNIGIRELNAIWCNVKSEVHNAFCIKPEYIKKAFTNLLSEEYYKIYSDNFHNFTQEYLAYMKDPNGTNIVYIQSVLQSIIKEFYKAYLHKMQNDPQMTPEEKKESLYKSNNIDTLIRDAVPYIEYCLRRDMPTTINTEESDDALCKLSELITPELVSNAVREASNDTISP